MSKAVMISIQPHWCEMIANGEKTIEIRKTRLKLETPFTCYIYCTKPRFEHADFFALVGKQGFYGGGKVIGEFVCDKVYELAPLNHAPDNAEQQACMSREEIVQYLKGRGWGWHISNLKIYDKPVDITNFRNCNGCEYMGDCDTYCWKPMQRPPQSWCYVEALET